MIGPRSALTSRFLCVRSQVFSQQQPAPMRRLHLRRTLDLLGTSRRPCLRRGIPAEQARISSRRGRSIAESPLQESPKFSIASADGNAVIRGLRSRRRSGLQWPESEFRSRTHESRLDESLDDS